MTIVRIILLLLLLFSVNVLVLAGEQKCFVGDNEVPCPGVPSSDSLGVSVDDSITSFPSVESSDSSPSPNTSVTSPILSPEGFYIGKIPEGPWKKDVLPEGFMSDTRSDVVFYSLFFFVIVTFSLLYFFKIKMFGKTLNEYVYPIRWYVLGCVLVVISQYTIVGGLANSFPLAFNVSQWIWQLLIALSVYTLVIKEKGTLGNVFVLAILYSFIIHGLKVSIRYFFYYKSLFYVLDRFLYGSLLVFGVIIPLGVFFWFLHREKLKSLGERKKNKR